MKKISAIFILILMLIIIHGILDAQVSVSYITDIQPVLSSNGCGGCHSFASSYNDLLAASSASTAEGVPIVYPAKPDSSVLIWRIEGELPSGNSINRMPPGGSLSNDTITIFRTWITEGAVEDIIVGVDRKTTWSEIKQKFLE